MQSNLTQGTSATFSVGHVICPDAGDVLSQIGPELKVTGEVMYLSDGGTEKDKFAVVRVAGIAAPLIVPTERLMRCDAVTSTECDANDRITNGDFLRRANPI